MSNIAVDQVRKVVSKQIVENGARQFTKLNTQLVGAVGLNLILPVQAKAGASKLGDMAGMLAGNMPITGVTAETFIIYAKAEWSYQVEEARYIDYIVNEIESARNAIIELELELYLTALSGLTSDIAAAAAGTFAYADLIAMRKSARATGLAPGPYHYVVHPDQMENLLVDTTLIDASLVTKFEKLNLSQGNVFNTSLGMKILETTKATAATTYCAAKDAIEFVEKTKLKTIKFDRGKAGEILSKGLVMYEMLDLVLKQPTWGCYMDDA